MHVGTIQFLSQFANYMNINSKIITYNIVIFKMSTLKCTWIEYTSREFEKKISGFNFWKEWHFLDCLYLHQNFHHDWNLSTKNRF